MQIDSIINLNRFFLAHPLSREEPVKAWVRFLSWQIRSRLHKEIVFPWIGGQSLLVRRSMTGATGNVYVGLHEFADMMVVLHFLRNGDLFLDIGANVGTYSVLASGVCGARSWAFEPDPITAAHLSRNLKLNNLEGLTRIYEFALGPEEGDVAFTIGLDTVNKVVAEGNGANVQIVHQEPLDSLVKDENPIMMKIDVEGYEDAMLIGASEALQLQSLKVIEIETLTPNAESLLIRNGFERAFYAPLTRTLTSKPNTEKASNSLFVRDFPFVQKRLAEAPAVKVLSRLI